MFKSKYAKNIFILVAVMALVSLVSVTCFAASGDVAGAVQSTWDAAKVQIKQVVNNVVFPVIDLVLAVCFFAKVALAYMDYRKHGQFEFTAPAILFGTLVFALTAPLYIWDTLVMKPIPVSLRKQALTKSVVQWERQSSQMKYIYCTMSKPSAAMHLTAKASMSSTNSA